MGIDFKTSPSKYVLLSDPAPHIQAFEIRHCLNSHTKKVVYYPDYLKSLKLGRLQTGQSVHGMATIRSNTSLNSSGH